MELKLVLAGLLGSLLILCFKVSRAGIPGLHHHGDPGGSHHGHGQGHGPGGHSHFHRHKGGYGWDDSEHDSGNAGFVQRLVPIFQLGQGFSRWFNRNKGGWHMDDSSEHLWSESGWPNPVPLKY